MARQSNKTFYSGTTAGVALVAGAWIGVSDRLSIIRAALQSLAGIGMIWIGMVARDDDVSDEGNVAPKDLVEKDVKK